MASMPGRIEQLRPGFSPAYFVLMMPSWRAGLTVDLIQRCQFCDISRNCPWLGKDKEEGIYVVRVIIGWIRGWRGLV